jgi:putative DNA primase/helicase
VGIAAPEERVSEGEDNVLDLEASRRARAARRARMNVVLEHAAHEEDPEHMPFAPEPGTTYTDLGNAERLAKRHGHELRYCDKRGGWHVWDGMRWKENEAGGAERRAHLVARSLYEEAALIAREAAEEPDPDARKRIQSRADQCMQHAKRTEHASRLSAMLEVGRSVLPIAVSADEVDVDPWLLNAQNGTIDLRTGELRPHDPRDLITRVCGAAYDPNAEAPRFQRFLEEVQPDPAVRSYLARLLGYSCVGLVREHVLGVCWGSGQNGKSVLLDSVTAVLGDYAKPGPSSLIVTQKNAEPHPTDVASCVSSRLVVVHETRRGVGFDASKVKLLTGGDRLTARFMRGDFFDFVPSHTLIMLSNYKPSADGSDAALWRRVQLCPFNIVIPEERRDGTLGETIRSTEASGVLRWLVDGCREWQARGLDPPPIVREQTEAYRASEDSIAEFIDERCSRVAGHRAPASELYAAYKRWSDEHGARPVRANDFSAELMGRGFHRTSIGGRRFYEGIGLQAPADAEGWPR